MQKEEKERRKPSLLGRVASRVAGFVAREDKTGKLFFYALKWLVQSY